jgi:hypothetical protein
MTLNLIEASFLGTVLEGVFYGNLYYIYMYDVLPQFLFIFRTLLHHICPVLLGSYIEERRRQKYSYLSHIIALSSMHCLFRP